MNPNGHFCGWSVTVEAWGVQILVKASTGRRAKTVGALVVLVNF